MTTILKFSHPLSELCAMKEFYETTLYPLLYRYVGTHVIHDKTEYYDPQRYNEIKEKTDWFIFHTKPLLSIISPFNSSDELIYEIINNYFFNEFDKSYSFIEPTELRQNIIDFILDEKRVNNEYNKALFKNYLK